MLSPNCHHEKSTVFVNQRQCFSLSEKQYSTFTIHAAARCGRICVKFMNVLELVSREFIQGNTSSMYRKTTAFRRDTLKSVVSSVRLFGNQSSSTVSITVVVTQRRRLKNQVYDFGIFMVLSCAGRCRATSCRIFSFLIMVGMCARTVISCEAFGFAGRISLSLVSIVMR